jgi:hypothetical protein
MFATPDSTEDCEGSPPWDEPASTRWVRVGGESVNVDVEAVEWMASDEFPPWDGVGNAGASEVANMVDWNNPLALGADATRRRKR